MDHRKQSTLPEAKRVSVSEFHEGFSSFMRQVRLGHAFIVTSHDEVVALIQPPPGLPRAQRQPGGLRGRISMAADFDELPADIVAGIDGDGA